MIHTGKILQQRLSLVVLTLLVITPATADIYKYIDKHGRVILNDKPQSTNYKLLVKTWKGWEEATSKIALQDFEINKNKHTPIINRLARQYGLPESLVHAVVTEESAYDTSAISRVGAVSLMQLMPETAKRYGVVNRRNPSDNVDGGTRYLRDLLILFNNNLALALAAYNAGEGAVKRYGNKIPPYAETQKYVNKVIGYTKSTVRPCHEQNNTK